MQKTVLLIIGIILSLPTKLYAENELITNVELSYVSKYLFRGWNLNDDPSMQGELSLTYGDMSAGLWGGSDQELGTEIDWYLSYELELSESLSLDIGIEQFRYDNAAYDIFELYAGLNLNHFGLYFHVGEHGYRYLELNYEVKLNDSWSLSPHIGVEEDDERLMDAGLQLFYTINDNFSAGLTLVDKKSVGFEYALSFTAAY